MAKDKCGIYQIKCGPTGRAYVGSSAQIYVRWAQHRRALRADKHHAPILQRAWNRHGEAAFYFIVLEECARSSLVEREQHYVDFLQPKFNTLLSVDRGLAEFNKARFALITHCPKGHPYDEANTMIHQGKRVCRKCNAERVAGIFAAETPEEREARRQYATSQYEKNRLDPAYKAAMREYYDAHIAEKKAYDAARKPLANERRRERHQNETPEQREYRLRLKRESYERHRDAALAKMRERYRLRASERSILGAPRTVA